MDDVRIYNYALTPQEVQKLYQDYGPEDASPLAEVVLDSPKTTGIFPEDPRTVQITSKLFKPSKAYTLEVIRPAGLAVKDYKVVPLERGNSPLLSPVVEAMSGAERVYRLSFNDGLVGQINTPFSLFYPRGVAHEQQETLKVRLKKWDRVIAETELDFTSYNKSRLSSYGISASSLLAADIPITYTLISQVDYQAPGSTSWGW